MRVYCETNFVLELVLGQEQSQACQDILALPGRSIELAIPAFSLVEPFNTLVRLKIKRQDLQLDLRRQRSELARNDSYSEGLRALDHSVDLLTRSIQDAETQFDQSRDRLLKAARILPLELGTLQDARIHESYLSPGDAIVLASILTDLQNNKVAQSCHINRNSKDFGVPNVETQLQALGCKLIHSFEHGLKYIQNQP